MISTNVSLLISSKTVSKKERKDERMKERERKEERKRRKEKEKKKGKEKRKKKSPLLLQSSKQHISSPVLSWACFGRSIERQVLN